MEFDNLVVERAERAATVIVNRPDKLNALNAATIGELDRAFEHLEADPAIRSMVLTGAGDKSFVAGADIGEIRANDPTRAHEFSLAGQRLMRRIERCGTPIDAATAREFGLVNAVVETGAVVASAHETAARLAAAAPLALAGIIAAAGQAGDVPPDQALAYESARFALCCATDDMREGTGAFLEKRKPEFTGRREHRRNALAREIQIRNFRRHRAPQADAGVPVMDQVGLHRAPETSLGAVQPVAERDHVFRRRS